MRVLVIGGAGFVGSHTVDALIERGYEVRVFDNLEPQVHGNSQRPAYLNPQAEFILGDVRDRDALRQALAGVEAVFYLAAVVGVGQSMYEIRRYVEVNSGGAANFLDILANEHHTVRKVVVASSMSVYGEGAYECDVCGPVYPQLRPESQLRRREWEMHCPKCGAVARPVPTPEDKPLFPASIYAITKRDHEEMFLVVGRAYGIPIVALRYFNIYGPRQALSNPYTGVVAIFASRMLNNRPPIVYEDGLQSRDFVHVSDVVQANLLALEREEANYQVFNVGTGQPTTVLEVAAVLGEVLGYEGKPKIENRYRAGDIRHCYADISRIRKQMGYEPKVSLREGLIGMVDWLREQNAVDKVQEAQAMLVRRGLIR
jgi:dTDP-L-rhamnose 4-epimerase